VDFLLSAVAIAEPLNRIGIEGIGAAVFRAIQATRQVVTTNTNLGMVLLLAPLAAVPDGINLAQGVEAVLESTTVEDAKWVYRAIRLAQPGGMGDVPDQDINQEPSMTLRTVMTLATERDLVARQYANGFREIFDEVLPALRRSMAGGHPLETAIIFAYLNFLALHPDTLIARKHGLDRAIAVSRRAAELLDRGWPECETARQQRQAFDAWLRHPGNRYNPGTTADLVTAALYAALRDGTIQSPCSPGPWGLSDI
jgi:triphosphoribosyl-dephospho-CoA synthase